MAPETAPLFTNVHLPRCAWAPGNGAGIVCVMEAEKITKIVAFAPLGVTRFASLEAGKHFHLLPSFFSQVDCTCNRFRTTVNLSSRNSIYYILHTSSRGMDSEIIAPTAVLMAPSIVSNKRLVCVFVCLCKLYSDVLPISAPFTYVFSIRAQGARGGVGRIVENVGRPVCSTTAKS